MLLQTPNPITNNNHQHHTHDRSHQEQHQHILQWCYNSSPSQVSCKHLRIVIDIIDATQITNIAGYSVVSHDNRTSHLRMDENVCLEKIATEEALVETFRREGDEMKNKYKSWYKALGLCNHHVEIARISGRMMRHETWSPEQRSDESAVQIQSNGRTIGRYAVPLTWRQMIWPRREGGLRMLTGPWLAKTPTILMSWRSRGMWNRTR